MVSGHPSAHRTAEGFASRAGRLGRGHQRRGAGNSGAAGEGADHRGGTQADPAGLVCVLLAGSVGEK